MTGRLSLILLLVGGSIGVLLHREQQRGTFEPFDRAHRSFLLANPGAETARALSTEPRVILARMDDPDLPPSQRAFDSWPPDPAEWQILFQNIVQYEPKTVAVQMPLVFDAVTAGLRDAAQRLPGFSLTAPASAAPATALPPELPILPQGLPELKVTGPVHGVPEFHHVSAPSLSGRLGVEEVDLGRHVSVVGDWCRVPLVARSGPRLVPALPLQALLAWVGIDPRDITVHPGESIRGPGGLRIPIEEDGCFRFYLPLTGRVPAVDADDFLFDREQANRHYPPGSPDRRILDRIPGSLVWIGADDNASRRMLLPDGNRASAADLFTRAIAVIQTGRRVSPLTPGSQIPVIAATLGWISWIVRWRRARVWIGALAGGVMLVLFSLFLFRNDSVWVPLAPSLILLAGSWIVCLLIPRRDKSGNPAP